MVVDLNGDGQLDIVIITENGDIWAFSGNTGKPIPHYPMRLGTPILAAPLVVDLHASVDSTRSSEAQDVHLVMSSDNGELIVVEGKR